MKTRLLLTACAAALLGLSACNRDREPADPTGPNPPASPNAAVTPADGAAPLAYESKSAFAEVKLTLPPAVKAHPDLHARLYAAGVRDLRQFVEGAQADRTEAGGDEGMPPYGKTIAFTPAAETGKLLSLQREDADYTGGAHGNALFQGVIWDKALKRILGPADLFRPGADLKTLDAALCAAVNAAKRARVPDAEPVALGGATFSCPSAAETPFVLAPGTAPGKAGGLIFLIGAYQVGPYAEGPYTVALPQALIRPLLAPAYADEFAGAPVKAGDGFRLS
jgi:hypothetical protein